MKKIILTLLLISTFSLLFRTIFENGKEFIKNHEMSVLTVYCDSNGDSIDLNKYGSGVIGMKISNKYNISENGKEFIKNHEKCVLTAYWDSNGYSIGWGHHGSDVTKDMKISQSQANKFFDKDIKSVEAAANRLINSLPYKYEFSQNFFDGLCSLIYNCGETGVKKSEFYQRLKRCRVRDYQMNRLDLQYSIAAVKTTKVTAPGHKIRRHNEYKLMLS